MKGLSLAAGLISVLFLSSAHASIYDTATKLPPDVKNVSYIDCKIGNSFIKFDSHASCSTYIEDNIINGKLSAGTARAAQCSSTSPQYIYCTYENKIGQDANFNPIYGRTRLEQFAVFYPKSENSSSCPPPEYPNYTFPYDPNSDGKPDYCYNPIELDNASSCASSANGGNLLPLGTNNAAKVCKTSPDGSQCGYSQVSAGNSTYYMVDLEINCFLGADVPTYNPDSNLEQPQPEQCNAYGDGFVCSADPSNVCDTNSGVCPQNCGYVNDQFVCFRDVNCAGAICDEPDAVDPNNPDPDPNNPDPNNPDPNNPDPNNPDTDSGGGTGTGGSTIQIDYGKLGDLMKDAAKTLIDENEIPDSTEVKDAITDAETDIKSAYDEFFDSNLFDEIIEKPSEGVFDDMKNMLPSGGSCTSFNFGLVSLDLCTVANKVRPILFYVFAFITLIYMRNVFFDTVRGNK